MEIQLAITACPSTRYCLPCGNASLGGNRKIVHSPERLPTPTRSVSKNFDKGVIDEGFESLRSVSVERQQ